jgi:hypothetical protein
VSLTLDVAIPTPACPVIAFQIIKWHIKRVGKSFAADLAELVFPSPHILGNGVYAFRERHRKQFL